RTAPLRRQGQLLGHLVERRVPGDRSETIPAAALLANPPQRHREPLGMVLALGVAGDLGADDALRIGLPLGAAHPADAVVVNPLDLKRAAAWAIVRADAVGDVERQAVLRRAFCRENISCRMGYAKQSPSNRRTAGVIDGLRCAEPIPHKSAWP